jgi:hypothetical protein
MKRIILMLTVAAFLVVALSITAPMAFAAKSCPDIGGCQTSQTDKPGHNPGFTTSNTGSSPVHECNSNPSGKCK